jgi:hypothetical protein
MKEKEFVVVVQRGKQRLTWPIKTANEEAARKAAERLLRLKGGKPSQVVSVTEKKQ